MKRYPLQTLLKLRAHRTENARLEVLEKQRAVRACQDECSRIELGITELGRERAGHRHRLLDPPAAGLPWPVVLEQRQAHIDLLAERIVAAQMSLQQAKQRLQEALAALEEAKQAYFRARAREDALEKRKGLWRAEQVALEDRREEEAAADLMQARQALPGQT